MNPWRFCVTAVLVVVAGFGCYLVPHVAAEEFPAVAVASSETSAVVCPAEADSAPVESPREVPAPLPIPVASVPASAQKPVKVAKGDMATVPGWMWVDVMNLRRVGNSNMSFGLGDRCGIDFGGTVEVLSVEGETVAVGYRAVGPSAGTRCPSGVIFSASTEMFAGLSTEHARVVNEK